MNRPYKNKRQIRPQIVLFVLILLTVAVTVFTVSLFKQYKDTQTPSEPNSDTPGSTLRDDTNTPSIPDTPSTPDTPSEVRLSFVAAGDNLIHQAIIDDAKNLASENSRSESYYFDPMYENIKDTFSSADIAFINQETMIAGTDSPYQGYPRFNTPQDMVSTLERLGIDVVNIATNHSYDLGGKGFSECIKAFKNSSITAIGGYESREDYNNIRIIEKDGVTIAFLAYTFGVNSGCSAGAGYENLVLPLIEESEMKRQVAEAKELADLVFVSMHWGVEDSFDVSAAQKSAAQTLVDAGVDVIIGTHPHVIQEMKWKNRSDGGKTLIAYSLGNFISTMYPAYNMLGGLLTFDIVKNGDECYIENPKFTPTITHYSLTRDSLKVYFLKDYSQDLYKKHGTSLRSESSGWSYEKLVAKVKEIIPSEFLNF